VESNLEKSILILGATGFVGKNISLKLLPNYSLFTTVRDETKFSKNIIYFDIKEKTSWENIKKINPTIIINCIGYGVVKTEICVNSIFEINYFSTVKFYNYLSIKLPKCKIIHIGTAFEYDLSCSELIETTPQLPLTYYGLSKLMASQYLLNNKISNPFIILRPFNMFGQFESESKIIPFLILAQKHKKVIDLSEGLQERDYFYVGDLANFILKIVKKNNFEELPKCVNVGTGKSISIKELANCISFLLPEYNPKFWNWGALPQRTDEYFKFYNASNIARELGFKEIDLKIHLLTTIQHYWNL